jgi:hypothetical protein
LRFDNGEWLKDAWIPQGKEVELRWLERAISFVVVSDLSRCARRNVKVGLLKKHGQPIGRESIEEASEMEGSKWRKSGWNSSADRGRVTLPAMFSAKLERQKRFHRLAILVAATVFATGVVLIAIWAVGTSSMLTTADADRAPIIIGVLIALAGLFALCLLAYGAVRVFGRFPSLWTAWRPTELVSCARQWNL